MRNKIVAVTLMATLLGVFVNYNFNIESKKQNNLVVMKKSSKK